jgi:predicted MFS family arabinose efflux permease
MTTLSQRRERWLLLTLAAVQFATVFDFMIPMPLGAQLMQLFDLTPTQFGLLVSVYMVTAAAVGFAASFVVDRFDRRAVLLALCAGFAATTVLTATAQSYAWLLAARATAGAFGGVLAATVLAIVGDTVPDGGRGRALGVVMSGPSFASILGIPISIWLAAWSSWRAPFFFNTALCAAILAAAFMYVPRVHAHVAAARGRSALAQISAVFGRRNHLRAFALTIALNFSGFLIVPFIAPYFISNVGISQTELPVTYFCGGLAALVFVRYIGRLTDLHGRRRMFVLVASASAFATLLVTHLPPVALWGAVIAQVLIMSTFPGRYVPAVAILQGAVVPELRGSFMSLNAALQQLSAGIASLVAAAMVGRGPGGELTNFGTVGWLSILATGWAIAVATTVRPAAPRPLQS